MSLGIVLTVLVLTLSPTLQLQTPETYIKYKKEHSRPYAKLCKVREAAGHPKMLLKTRRTSVVDLPRNFKIEQENLSIFEMSTNE